MSVSRVVLGETSIGINGAVGLMIIALVLVLGVDKLQLVYELPTHQPQTTLNLIS